MMLLFRRDMHVDLQAIDEACSVRDARRTVFIVIFDRRTVGIAVEGRRFEIVERSSRGAAR